jgi:hypothetical protein
MGRRAESQTLVDRALFLQELDDASWDEVERCLLRAVEVDSGNLSARAEIALFYQMAVQFATVCRDRAAELIDEMNTILGATRLAEFVRRVSSSKV